MSEAAATGAVRRFSWGRALAHALVLPAIVIGYLLLRDSPYRSAAFWKAAAGISAIWAATAIPISYLHQTGRKAASTLLSMLTIAGLFGIGQYFKAKTEARTFTSEERTALVASDEDGRKHLRHPTLGFSFLHPGPEFAPSVNQAFRADIQFYAFDAPALGDRLLVGLFKGQGESIESLRLLLEEMRKGILQGDGKGHTGQPSPVEQGNGPIRSLTLSSAFADGRRFVTRAYGLDVPGRSPFAVILAVTTAQPELYTELLGSFHP